MVRRIVAVVVPSLALLILTMILPPLNLGYLSFLMVAASLMMAAAGAFLIHPDPEEPTERETSAWLVLLALLSAVASGLFWFRLWQYDAWDLATIPVGLLYFVGFWWPGLFLAALAWILAGTQVYRTVHRYTVILLVGVLAATAGAASYQIVYLAYFKVHDGQRLDLVMERLASSTPGSLTWQYERGLLSVSMESSWVGEAPPYTAYSSLNHEVQGVLRLLHRADVTEVNVRATANGLLLFTGDATDAAPGDSSEWVRKLDRSILKDGGRLDQGSLDEMMEILPGDFSTLDEQKAFGNRFRCACDGADVSIVFEPGAEMSVGNVAEFATAYRLANRVIGETVAYFPDVETFRVNLAGKEWTVPRKSAEAKPFYLQADMTPAEAVVGLVVRDRGANSSAFSLSTFKSADPLSENQLAIHLISRTATEDIAGRLFQVIPTSFARVIFTDVARDGAVTVFVLPSDEEAAGPVSIAPDKEEAVGNQWIANSGLLSRLAFAEPAPKTP